MNEEKKMNHSMGQQKLFFVLCEEAGIDKDEAIKRAKEKYNVPHLADLTAKQMGELIAALNRKLRKTKPTVVNRVVKYRVFSKRLERFLVEEDFIDDFYWIMDFNKETAEMSVQDNKGGEVDVMEWTGRLDYHGVELYQFDIFITRSKEKWLIDWSDKDHAWVASNFDTNAMKLLSTFSAVKKIGSVYEDVKE